ncbi:MAG: GNAT family N-acetyltransferase [Polyangiaceae bacterium]
MTTFQIQQAQRTDLETVLGFVRAYYEHDGIAFDAKAVRRGLGELLADASIGGAWLVSTAEAVVGYFVLTYGFDLEFGGRQATVTELYVAPEHRRRGAGAAALRFAEGLLRQRGIGTLELQVGRGNAAARAFYAALGFEQHARIPLSKRIAPA